MHYSNSDSALLLVDDFFDFLLLFVLVEELTLPLLVAFE